MFKHLLISATLTILCAGNVIASEFGTPEEADLMLRKAVAEVKADKTQAIDKFNRNDRAFRDRDLYVFCFGTADGRFLAHEHSIGADVRQLRDKYGRMFGQEMYDRAKDGAIVAVESASPLPGTTYQMAKTNYVTRIGDDVCGVSVFNKGGKRFD